MEKAEELDTLRINELNSSQEFTEFTEKIEALRTIYDEIMTTYNNDNGNDSVKKFLETKWVYLNRLLKLYWKNI